MWPAIGNKLRYLLRGRRIDRDLAQELEFHRDMLTADQERLGYSHETALLNARRKMGNTTLMTEYSRDAWIVSGVDTLEPRHSLRASVVRAQSGIHRRGADDAGARHRRQHRDLSTR